MEAPASSLEAPISTPRPVETPPPSRTRGVLIRVAVFLAVLGGFVGLVTFWPEPTPTQQTAEVWTCSMHPQIRLPKPGQCPICGMNLVPVSQLSSEKAQLEARAGVAVELIARRELWKEIRTVGRLDYNERRVAVISARIAGRVDRVHADFTGLEVKKGDHLVDIYSPDLYTAQRELLLSLESAQKDKGSNTSLEAARTKLELWGLLPEQIKEIEASKKVHTHLTIFAPQAGVVIEKSIREGQYVKDGDPLYKIAELDPIWLYANVYEYDLAWVHAGQKIAVSVEAYPGESFEGVVTFIDPFIDDTTRTVRVRANLKNADRRLKPSMYAQATIRVPVLEDGSPAPSGLEGKFLCPMHPEVISDGAGTCSICGMQLVQIPPAKRTTAGQALVLAVPASAVLDTGRRRVVYRKTRAGAFELVDVTLGPRTSAQDASGKATSYFPVLKGLNDGDEIVVRGGFLLDSQRQLEGMPSLFFPEGRSGINLHAGHQAPPGAPGADPHAGHKQHDGK